MLKTECPECQQMIWITSDTRFATYHSLGNTGKDCPGSRATVPVPPTPAALRRQRKLEDALAWSATIATTKRRAPQAVSKVA